GPLVVIGRGRATAPAAYLVLIVGRFVLVLVLVFVFVLVLVLVDILFFIVIANDAATRRCSEPRIEMVIDELCTHGKPVRILSILTVRSVNPNKPVCSWMLQRLRAAA